MDRFKIYFADSQQNFDALDMGEERQELRVIHRVLVLATSI